MTTRLNVTDINWLVSASLIQTNLNQNLTLDVSSGLLKLNQIGTSYATFDTSFNFINLPNCSVKPTLNNQIINKTYYDTFNNNSKLINTNANSFTSTKNTITYLNSNLIKNNFIKPTIDSWITNSQTFTFGPSKRIRWVAVGDLNSKGGGVGTMTYSSDGNVWNTITGSTSLLNSGRAVAWNGNIWVAAGSTSSLAGAICYSFDGITWTLCSGITSLFSTSCNCLVWNNDYWIVGGQGTANTMAYSYDGINWIGMGTTIFSTVVYGLAWNGLLLVAAGQGNAGLGYSYNGLNWTSLGTTILTTGTGVGWNGNLWIASGQNVTAGITAAYSFNGTSWTGYTTTITPFTTSSSVGWNGKVWNVTGSPGNLIFYSYDGFIWSSGITLSALSAANTIAWNGERWIVGGGGASNNLVSSFDGINWTGLGTSPFGSSSNCYGIAFNNSRENTIVYPSNVYLASFNIDGGSTTAILFYSTDAITTYQATLTTSNSIFNTSCNGTVWNGSIWVAVGESTPNTIAYTFNTNIFVGNNTNVLYPGWIGLGTRIFSTAGRGLSWNGNMFVAVGQGTNGIAYSYDGINWIGSGTNILSNGYAVDWNGSIWVAVGSGSSTIAYSSDGINWTGLGVLISLPCRTVKWNGTMWVAGGTAGFLLGYSYNGINWITTTSPFSLDCFSVDWNGSLWVAGGQGGNSLAYSYNGINWTGLGVVGNLDLGVYTVLWGGNKWLAGGRSSSPTVQRIIYSNTGNSNWSAVSSSGVTGKFVGYCSSISWVSNIGSTYIQQPVIAGGQGTNTLAYSPDGIQWTGLGTNTFSTRCNGVVWSGNLWVACGQGTNSLAYSYDGLNWTGLGSSIFSTGFCVAWNGTRFVAGGEGTNVLAYSSDGISWTGLGSILFTSVGSARGIAWNGTSFVAVGYTTVTGLIAYSSDGLSWTQATVTPSLTAYIGNAVAWSGRQWLAGFSGAGIATTCLLYTSAVNGSGTWAIQGTVTCTNGVQPGIHGIAFNGYRWIIAGENNGSSIIQYALDSSVPPTFTSTTSPLTNRTTSVCWNGRRFIAVGGIFSSSTVVAYSRDGITWYTTVSNTSIFTTRGYCVSGNSGIGATPINSQIVINQNGYSQTNQLDIVNPPYYNFGYDEFTTTVKSNVLT